MLRAVLRDAVVVEPVAAPVAMQLLLRTRAFCACEQKGREILCWYKSKNAGKYVYWHKNTNTSTRTKVQILSIRAQGRSYVQTMKKTSYYFTDSATQARIFYFFHFS